jgi:spermidine synthase
MQKLQYTRSHFLLLVIGISFGIASQIESLLFSPDKPGIAEVVFRLFIALLIVPSLLFTLQNAIRGLFARLDIPSNVLERYRNLDTLPFTVLLFPLIGSSETNYSAITYFIVISLFILWQFFLLFYLMSRERKNLLASVWLIPLAFHLSGFCALIYQIVWQRVLFTEFGVNIESITVIVAIFMLGLGLGSLFGGVLSRKYPARLPDLFMTCEILTGFFGIFSLQLIQYFSRIPSHETLLNMTITVFALLFIPTLLMGATLPILVTYIFNNIRSVGNTVGILYFINTLGAAVACFVTADIFFTMFGKQTTVLIAAAGNLLIGFLIYNFTRLHTSDVLESQASQNVTTESVTPDSTLGKSRRFLAVLLLSCLTGYISLSQEILWFRAISYVTGGKPDVFSHVLGVFLLGIAGGALFGKKLCQRCKDIPLTYIAMMLTFSALIYYISLPMISRLMTVSETLGMFASYFLVGIISFFMGGIFPILCHYGTTSRDSVGISISWIYFANILGSTAGPLITGFILLDIYTLQQNILFLTVFVILFAASVFNVLQNGLSRKVLTAAAVVGIVAFIAISNKALYSHLLEKLQYKTNYRQGEVYKYVIQNRSGIIAVANGNPDVIFGGGMYDGRFSTDPVSNTNTITRAYMMAALHPRPADVLEIGLSGGAWAKVISDYEDLKELTIVEINPGYLELIGRYQQIASILSDPKVTVYIDDGRRWLRSNPAAKFDVILMNTTFHWRDGITNLLSEEFLRICKSHLKEGGVLYYNTTDSADVVYTAASVFRHVTMYVNFVAASDTPFAMDSKAIRDNLAKFKENGSPVFDRDLPSRQLLNKLSASRLDDLGDKFRQKKDLKLITDDNMATEFNKKTIMTLILGRWPRLAGLTN